VHYKYDVNSTKISDRLSLKKRLSISIPIDNLIDGLLIIFHPYILPVLDKLTLGLRKKMPSYSVLVLKIGGRQ